LLPVASVSQDVGFDKQEVIAIAVTHLYWKVPCGTRQQAKSEKAVEWEPSEDPYWRVGVSEPGLEVVERLVSLAPGPCRLVRL
jgi:hypothetical protein